VKTSPRVSIIILNWNGWKDTIECLDSLFRTDYQNFEVLVLDNGSEDDSLVKIKEYCDERIRCQGGTPENLHVLRQEDLDVQTDKITAGGTDGAPKEVFARISDCCKIAFVGCDKNYGFAEGNNIAIRLVLRRTVPDYFLLLNNDTIVDPHFLAELVDVAEADSRIGFVGPKILRYDCRGRNDIIDFAGGLVSMRKGHSYKIGENEADSGQYDQSKSVDYAEGSCLLVRTEVIRKIGLLDARFFTYWEEADWCRRGFEAGYKSVYAPNARIWHKGASSGRQLSLIYYGTRNSILFVKKHATNYEYVLFWMHFVFYRLCYQRIVYAICRRNLDELKAFLRGAIDGMKFKR